MQVVQEVRSIRGFGPLPGKNRAQVIFSHSGKLHTGKQDDDSCGLGRLYVGDVYFFEQKSDFALPLSVMHKIQPWDLVVFLKERESYIYDWDLGIYGVFFDQVFHLLAGFRAVQGNRQVLDEALAHR